MRKRLDERLADLIALAATVREVAFPNRAALLDILSFMSVEDLWHWKKSGEADELTIRRVADQVGRVPESIQNVVTRFLRNDLQDYSAEQERLKSCFENCGAMEAEAIPWMQQDLGKTPLHFLFHALPHIWDADEQDFSLILRGDGVADNTFADACDGYLVASGMAFSSSIELLAASHRGRWLGWQTLWQLYF
jgi:hypothetical protein